MRFLDKRKSRKMLDGAAVSSAPSEALWVVLATVIPAKAGIHAAYPAQKNAGQMASVRWIPAFAGMTACSEPGLRQGLNNSEDTENTAASRARAAASKKQRWRGVALWADSFCLARPAQSRAPRPPPHLQAAPFIGPFL
ncbi:hypothetical protein [Ottowia testudinis]|uniref:Uncharacterized protein n=1 Tax=Ottowia testudinis TaxID=2816950 RepID=A0A975CK95_9BURK|nr:hypothetical protein [Ottowia testudinis]QTD45734.1 hypothetical protein J1M35_02070 [Ottowia testudinis]